MRSFETVAKTALVGPRGRVLVLRRSHDDSSNPGAADFPGGGVEPGESPASAASREIQEEAGLQVAAQDLGLVYAFTRYEAKIGKILIRLFFVAHVTTTDVRLSDEHDAYSWREAGELPEAFAGRSWESAIEFVLAHNLLQKGASE